MSLVKIPKNIPSLQVASILNIAHLLSLTSRD